MHRAVSWLLVALAIASVGCNKEDDTLGGLKREKTYKNVISLSPSTTELLLTQGASGITKGRTAADNFPESTVKNVPIVASVKPDYEKISGMKPDLVVYDASLYNSEDAQKIKELGADVFVIDANTVDKFVDQLYELGSLIGAETNISGYIDKILAARTAALGNALSPAPKVAVMLAGSGSSEHMAAGTDSFIADIVRSAGGEPVGPKSDKFEKANAEFLLTQNPDVILLGVSAKDPAATDRQVQAILGDPRLKPLKAVANRRLVGIDQDVMLRRGSRVDRLIDKLHAAIASKVVAK
jgi:iron complex transport system substrate-binding protein